MKTLSDEIHTHKIAGIAFEYMIPSKVRKFIKKLKENFDKEEGTGYLMKKENRDKIINKLAGKKLT